MKRVVALALFLSRCVFAGPPEIPGRTPGKIQALILTGYNMHEWRVISLALAERLDRTGKFEVRINEEPVGATEATFEGYDVLVLNFTNYKGKFGPTWPQVTREAFLRFLKNGKGVVAYHSACGSFEEWPEYDRVLGGTWRVTGAHAPYHEFRVDIRDSEHPVMKGLARSFIQVDELYHGLSFQPSIHVLATAYDDPKNCSVGPTPTCGSGKHEPVIWTVNYRGGRVFHTILGHDRKSISTDGFIATFVRGTEWAATGKVTLPPPTGLQTH